MSDDAFAVVMGLFTLAMALAIRLICKVSKHKSVTDYYMGGSYVLFLIGAVLLVSPLFLS